MRIMFLGDIVGSSGRAVVIKNVPRLREELKLDFVIANGENSAHGFGITAKICDELLNCGIDVITGGNHSFDQNDIVQHHLNENRIMRPANADVIDVSGRGVDVFTDKNGNKILIINILGRLFMNACDNPFAVLDNGLPINTPKQDGFDAVIVDIHCEASSEKYAVGHYCDGRASLVVGTHTHTPSADCHIMEHGTAYQTDAGMCGDYDSIIGMDKHSALNRFLGTVPRPRLQPSNGEASLCGVVIETSNETGLTKTAKSIIIGGVLQKKYPSF